MKVRLRCNFDAAQVMCCLLASVTRAGLGVLGGRLGCNIGGELVGVVAQAADVIQVAIRVVPVVVEAVGAMVVRCFPCR